MVAVYVCIDAEQSAHNHAHGLSEVLWEGHTYCDTWSALDSLKRITQNGGTNGVREHSLIIKDVLGPVHKRIDILGSRQLRRTLVLLPIFPEVFISEDKVNTGYPAFHHSHLGPADIIGHYKASMNGSDVERRSDAAYLLRRAEFGNCAVEHIQMVEEVNGYS